MKKLLLAVSLLLATGCASLVKCEDVVVQGVPVSYCMGKVSGDGQEGVFRDAYVEGKPILSHYGSGSSLWGQALQGAVGDAALAGGMYGAARALRPSQTNNAVGSANVQGQEQSNEGSVTGTNTQTQGTSATSTSTASPKVSSSNVSGSSSSSNSTSNGGSSSTVAPSVKQHDYGHHGHDK